MKKMISVFCIALLILSLAACSKKEVNGPTPAPTPEQKETFLHHAAWNMTKNQLTEAVGKDKLQQGSTETILNWMLTKELSYIYGERKVSVAYLFNNEDALTSITVQAHCNEGESVAEAMASTRKAMDKYYGKSSGEDKNAHWHTEDAVISLMELTGAKSSFIIQYASAEGHSH